MIESGEDPSWAQYAEAVLEIGLEPLVRFRVRRGPTSHDLERMARAGLPEEWAVVTPCNPRGAVIGAAEKAARLADGALELDRRGIRHWPGTGGSEDWSHTEPGFLLGVARDVARDLAKRWGQSAFFAGQGRRVWLCPALVRGDDILLTPPSEPSTS